MQLTLGSFGYSYDLLIVGPGLGAGIRTREVGPTKTTIGPSDSPTFDLTIFVDNRSIGRGFTAVSQHVRVIFILSSLNSQNDKTEP